MAGGSSPPPKTVLIDGSALIYRAYYAIPSNLRTRSGLPTNAIYGFATMFRKLMAGRQPSFGAVVFDAPGPTFRDEAYPEYKAERERMPDELRVQLPWIDKVVEAHRFRTLRMPGYEADDVIGTLARQGEAEGMEVLIVSVDKDFAQLIGDQIRMFDPFKEVTYDAELVRKKWGVPPRQFVDLLSLVGDKIDNIPGVPGIGTKGAVQLLDQYGTLDGILENLSSLKGRSAKALAAHVEDAKLSRALATIDREVPLDVGLDGLSLVPPDVAVVDTLYRELAFFSLLSDESQASDEAIDIAVLDDPQARDAFFERLRAASYAVVLPLQDLPRGPAVGFGLAAGRDDLAYLPSDDDALARLGALLADGGVKKVTHDAKALRRWAKSPAAGFEAALDEASLVGDTMVMSYLVDPTGLIPHRLEQLTKGYLHHSLIAAKKIQGVGKKQKRLAELPPADIAPLAGSWAQAVFELYPILDDKLRQAEQGPQYEERELPLTEVLAQVELNGVLVDGPDLSRMGQEFQARLDSLQAEIHGHAGRAFNVGSPKQLSQVLFEELALPVVKRTKTGYSTDSEVLERLAPKHPIAALLLEHRKVAKLINTYTDVLQAAVDPSTGRIHATLQQTVSATGRLISTDPDLQRTPIRTPEGKRIRRAFIAPEGSMLVSADWSQIELRILAHVSEDPALIDAFKQGLDVHRRTASELFEVPADAVTDAQRGVGKTVNFATIYGQGAIALAKILGVEKKQAERYIERYFAVYAGVREWLDRTIDDAMTTGYVTTMFGRRRLIPELHAKNTVDQQTGQRMAANTPIQGSAADLCKAAMLNIARQLSHENRQAKMVMQIHDELVFEVPNAEVQPVRTMVKDHMERVYPLRVPLVVDVGVGRTWADAH